MSGVGVSVALYFITANINSFAINIVISQYAITEQFYQPTNRPIDQPTEWLPPVANYHITTIAAQLSKKFFMLNDDDDDDDDGKIINRDQLYFVSRYSNNGSACLFYFSIKLRDLSTFSAYKIALEYS